MRSLQTPWGPVPVGDVVPPDFSCAQCGRCCSGFVLPMRDVDKDAWYRRFLTDSVYEYPKDIGAIVHLFHKIPEAFAADGQPLHTCRAFNRQTRRCDLVEQAPSLRPIACWAFPYNYDLESLLTFPFPWCAIVQKTLLRLQTRMSRALANSFNPLRIEQ